MHPSYQAEERRTVLADWVTAMFAVFWSVWWGFFMDSVLQTPDMTFIVPLVVPRQGLEINKNLYLAMNALTVSIFSITYVRWLWSAHKTTYPTLLLRDLVRFSVPFGFMLISLASSTALAGYIAPIPDPLIFYGLVLTGCWPAVVLITIWFA